MQTFFFNDGVELDSTRSCSASAFEQVSNEEIFTESLGMFNSLISKMQEIPSVRGLTFEEIVSPTFSESEIEFLKRHCTFSSKYSKDICYHPFHLIAQNVALLGFGSMCFAHIDFSGVRISDCIFRDCLFRDCIFDNAILRHVTFEDCDFEYCPFIKTTFVEVDIIDCTKDGSNFKKEKIDEQTELTNLLDLCRKVSL